jgi:hypothetical protein
MLIRLSGAIRVRSARLLAILFLVCVLAPSAALALGDGSRAAHCFSDTTVGAHVHKKSDVLAQAHDHDHGTAIDHQHSNGSDDGTAADQQCCGLFCLSSLPTSVVGVDDLRLPASAAVTAIAQGIKASEPGCLYRPPIYLS